RRGALAGVRLGLYGQGEARACWPRRGSSFLAEVRLMLYGRGEAWAFWPSNRLVRR
ncbi:unnamed protein product, partial [Musa textilis]